MLYDGLELAEGASITNATVAKGTAFPSGPSEGELFYRTDLDLLHVYDGAAWVAVGAGSGDVSASENNTFTGDNVFQGVTEFQDVVSGITPTADAHLATKAYVDSVAAGLDPKASVRAATTANITLSGTQTVDGVSLIAGNRVLVKDQSTASQNGIYVVASGAWSRASDFDGTPASEVTSGAYMFVEEGTTNGDKGFVLTTNNPITLGTTALAFSQFSTISQITSTTDLPEGTNLYYTQARFDSAFTAKSTTNLSEGTNLYYTNARARAAISLTAGSSGATYSSSTGVLDLSALTGGSSSLTATYVGYGNGSNALTGSSTFTFASGTNTLSIGTNASPGSLGLGTANSSALLTAGSDTSGTSAQKWSAMFSQNLRGTGVAPLSTGLSIGWNRSAGEGETNLVYGTSAGSAPALHIASYNGTTYTERLRITSAGAWGLAGANYGTSGQVLTSNGSGSAPTWQNASSSFNGGTITSALVIQGALPQLTLGDTTNNGRVTSAVSTAGAGQAMQVLGANATTSGQAGGSVTVAGGASSGVAAGGSVTIQAGNSSSSSPAQVTIAGSFNTTANTGGSVVIQGGTSTGGTAGVIAFQTGNSNTERLRITATGAFSLSGVSNYGTSGQVLTSNGDAPPTWQSVSAATATNIAGGGGGQIPFNSSSGTTSFSGNLTFSSSSTGALNLSGTAPTLAFGSAAGIVKATDDGLSSGTGYSLTLQGGDKFYAATNNATLTGGDVILTGGGVSVNASSTSGTITGGNVLLKGGIPLTGGSGTKVGGYVAIFTGATTSLTERLRITKDGAWSVGTGGTATGNSGQVLTSNGSGTPPTWQSVSASLTSTYVGYGNGSNLVTGTANFSFTNSSNTLAIGGDTASARAAVVRTPTATTGTTALGTPDLSLVAGNGLINVSHSGNLLLQSGSAASTNDGYIAMTTGVAGTFTERLRILGNGAWSVGTGGTATGTSGQVLTSNGSGSAPTWQTVSATFTGGTVSGATTFSSTVTGNAGLELTSTTAVAVNGSGGSLRLGYLNAAITSTQDAFVTWTNGTQALATGGGHSANGTLVLASRNVSSAGISLATSNTVRMSIRDDGRVQIGGTSTNASKLYVAGGGAEFVQGTSVVLNGTAGSLHVGYLNAAITSTDDAFVALGGTSAAAAVSPTQVLGTVVVAARNVSNAGVSLATGGTSRLFIHSSGAFGIGGANYGTTGQVLQSNGSGAAPSWGAYTETKQAVASAATTTIDLSAGLVAAISMTTDITTLAFSNVPASGRAVTVTLFFAQDATGAHTITWPASVKFSGGAAVVLTATPSKTDIIQLITYDGGTTWFATVVGMNF